METQLVWETQSDVEALGLQEMLEGEGIVAKLVHHRDTAYPGIADKSRSGTEVRVAADQAVRAGELIREYLAAEPVGDPSIGPPPDKGPPPGLKGPGWLLTSLILLGLLAVAAYLASPN